MSTKITRTRRDGRDVLTLSGEGFSVTVEVRVTGLELDASTVETMLHAPLATIAERLLAGHDAARRETI